MSKQNNHEYR